MDNMVRHCRVTHCTAIRCVAKSPEKAKELQAENEQAVKFLEEALPNIICENHYQSGLITAIGTFLKAFKEK